MKKENLIMTLFFFLCCLRLTGQDIMLQNSYNSWTSLSISSADLVSAAPGKNLVTTYNSNADQLLPTIYNSDNNTTYTITVAISMVLPDNTKISVIRTGEGATFPAQGVITCGDTVPIEATTSGQTFFTGRRNLTDIPVRVITSGVSLDADPMQYIRDLTFSISY